MNRSKILRSSKLLSPLVVMTMFAVVASAVSVQDPLGGKKFEDIIKGVVSFANTILAPLSTLMILIAAFLYMTGGGNPEKITTAHRVLIWALVGIAIVLLSNGALAIIKNVLGAT
ncbi:MAG: TrbC/VirB2 family protein [Candidatus Sungbacteria bacterium]|uniref:TrbC/VirB2 family protein n=1 Tax=Candidatus Sungiibacteriota bacterium TaxID=2750080 RepID=A0A932YWL5_9BACT|nr:TrbC/VirB2 family protein [Candidatus Sungbacteria bacterium]